MGKDLPRCFAGDWVIKAPPFRFLDAAQIFPLVDGELELVEPAPQHIADMLAACQHPLTKHEMPQQANTTQESLDALLKRNPRGHVPEDAAHHVAPGYTFWMRLKDGAGGASPPAPVRMAGSIGLRIANTTDIEFYLGHIGYHVLPPARGHHYAARACRLLMPLARAHGQATLWITCNPDNLASRRTCEALGAELIETIAVPRGHPLYEQGDRYKCRYRITL